MELLNQTGGLITLGLGLVNFFRPHLIQRFASLKGEGRAGVSEVRATYGGFFIALGLACLIVDSPDLYAGAGIAWLGSAVGRVVALALDRSFVFRNYSAVLFEATMGWLLIV